MAEHTYDTILVEQRDRVGLITFNRPKQLNALTTTVQREVAEAVEAFDVDRGIGAIIITGSEKAFAAGADIKEMAELEYPGTFYDNFMANWERVTRARTPIITAVAGYALGGGCEVAMMGDIIIAAENARFGQPEINLGVIPGMGGSQRLTRAVGRYKAMDLILTGRHMDAAEAERAGLVSRVVPTDKLLDEAFAVANTIAAKSLYTAMVAKRVTNRALETTLAEGLEYEQATFYAMFGTADHKEGMAAFIDKRDPQWDR